MIIFKLNAANAIGKSTSFASAMSRYNSLRLIHIHIDENKVRRQLQCQGPAAFKVLIQ